MHTRRTPSPSTYYWLVARRGEGLTDVLTVDSAAQEPLLPVFASERRVREFMRGIPGKEEWRARPTGNGELVSVLLGPCARVKRVALDPPRGVFDRGRTEPAGLSRDVFVDSLLGRGRAWFDGDLAKRGSRPPTGSTARGKTRGLAGVGARR